MRRPRQFVSDSIDRAVDVQRNPRVLLQWLEESLIKTWLLRGGGFYGLIFLVVFITLQLQTLLLELMEAEDAVDFVTSQLLEAAFKFLTATFGNMIQAFIWPLLFLNWVGAWGVPALIAAFLSFDRWGKPYINKRIPQLREAELAKQEQRAARSKEKGS